MVTVLLDQVSKRFDDGTLALDDVSLTVRSGELLALIGPSGSGKTTLLRVIAGLDAPSAGRIRFDTRTVTRRPPDRRDIGMVFQQHALFPHLSVGENVAFGLEARGVERQEIPGRVADGLSQVQLDGFAGRQVETLSVGQQQRVALARALVTRPRLLLLDDPLASLDDRLRADLQAIIREHQRDMRATVIYVTHDHAEGLAMADRVALLHEGRIVQAGTPHEVWQRPASSLSARLLGPINLLSGMVAMAGPDVAIIALPDGSIVNVAAGRHAPDLGVGIGAQVTLAVRPEQLRLVADDGPGTIGGTVLRARLVGGLAEYALDVESHTLLVRLTDHRLRAEPGESLRVAVSPDGAFLLAEGSGQD